MEKGAIYIRVNPWYRFEHVIKMGISSFVRDRESAYITGEVERGEYLLVIEILLHQMKTLDKCLKQYFKSYHIYKGGGTEFYKTDIIEMIEPFLKQMNIYYKVLDKDEINLCERIRNMPNVDKLKSLLNKINIKT